MPAIKTKWRTTDFDLRKEIVHLNRKFGVNPDIKRELADFRKELADSLAGMGAHITRAVESGTFVLFEVPERVLARKGQKPNAEEIHQVAREISRLPEFGQVFGRVCSLNPRYKVVFDGDKPESKSGRQGKLYISLDLVSMGKIE